MLCSQLKVQAWDMWLFVLCYIAKGLCTPASCFENEENEYEEGPSIGDVAVCSSGKAFHWIMATRVCCHSCWALMLVSLCDCVWLTTYPSPAPPHSYIRPFGQGCSCGAEIWWPDLLERWRSMMEPRWVTDLFCIVTHSAASVSCWRLQGCVLNYARVRKGCGLIRRPCLKKKDQMKTWSLLWGILIPIQRHTGQKARIHPGEDGNRNKYKINYHLNWGIIWNKYFVASLITLNILQLIVISLTH